MMSFFPKNEAKAGSWLKDLYSGKDGNCPLEEFDIFLVFSIIKTNILRYRDAYDFFFNDYQTTDDESLSECATKIRPKNDPIFTLSPPGT